LGDQTHPRGHQKALSNDPRCGLKSTPNGLIDRIDPTFWNISGNMGLVSAGRVDKDTPPLTTPSHTSKSSAMDISSHIF